METLVMKFGGASVGTTTALSQVLGIVLQEVARWGRVVVVVSALDGVTDSLLDAAHLAQFGNERGYRRIAANLRQRHLALAEGLALGKPELAALQADLDKLLFDLLNAFQRISGNTQNTLRAQQIDEILAIGEKLASRIVAMLLRQHAIRAVAIDSTDLVITDEVFGSAMPDLRQTQARIDQHLIPMLERGILPVITGYIGATPAGKPTTLGRGGSDYSASVLAVCTQAKEVWVWSDVDGIMSADPNEVPTARVVPALSYAEMAELAYFGARILHARMVGPLQQHNIPLRVKNVYKPQLPGTLIHMGTPTTGVVKSVTHIHGLSLLAPYSGPLTDIVRLVNDHLQKQLGTPADVMISAQSASRSFLCSVVPPSAGPDAVTHLVETLGRELAESESHRGWLVEPVSLVTVIGEDINASPGLIAGTIGALGDLSILGASFGPGGCSLSLAVRAADGAYALRRLHEQVLGG
ncbi:MAG: aspartate kinase [Anaerolineae bacterium]|jgi:aspartate kinase|nr:aspartate kinase [Anaerolineae bacterium]